MYGHILIPTDGSPLSTVAMERSMDLARELNARVTVLTAMEPFHLFAVDAAQLADTRAEFEQHSREAAAAILSQAEYVARAVGVPCSVLSVESDQPHEAIIDAAARNGCDLIAMASHGRRGLSALLLGSETTKVLTHSKLPVLVYR